MIKEAHIHHHEERLWNPRDLALLFLSFITLCTSLFIVTSIILDKRWITSSSDVQSRYIWLITYFEPVILVIFLLLLLLSYSIFTYSLFWLGKKIKKTRLYTLVSIALPIFLGIVILPTLIAGFFAFRSLYSNNRDAIRYYDFARLSKTIDTYYSKYGYLPSKLDDLKSIDSSIYTADPFTREPYGYKTDAGTGNAINNTTYSLCATFEADPIVQSGLQLNLNKGYNCIPYITGLTGNLNQANGSNAKYYNLNNNFVTLIKPASGEKLCYGQPYTLQWKADPSIKTVQLFLAPPYGQSYTNDANNPYNPFSNDTTSLFSPHQEIPAQTGSYTWTVGQIDSQKKLLGDAFTIGMNLTFSNGKTAIYTGEGFSIVDCAKKH